MLISIVDNRILKLSQVFEHHEAVIYNHFSIRDPKAAYVRMMRYDKWDGWYRKYNKNKQTLSKAFLGELIQLCDDNDIPYEVVDLRDKPKCPRPNFDSFDNKLIDGITLMPHQMRCLQSVCMGGKNHTADFKQYNDLVSETGIMDIGTGGGKCLGKGTKVLMFDCTVKNVEDIKIGDLLMGDDSKSRKVLSVCAGQEKLYKVYQKYGESYIVNESHILSLKRTKRNKHDNNYKKVVDISVGDYINSNKTFKHLHKGYKVGIDFKEDKIPFDPYLLGLWLGDGISADLQICVNRDDIEIVDYLREYCSNNGFVLIKYPDDIECMDIYAIRIYKGSRKPDGIESNNWLRREFIKLKLLNNKQTKFNNKHVPDIFKFNSREVRLKILAGFIDSDGESGNGHNRISIIHRNGKLIEDIAFISKSLGFRTTVKKCFKRCTTSDYKAEYTRITISGNIEQIPNILSRKKCTIRTIKKDPLLYGIKLEYVGAGDYFGFEIDGNKRFMLGDFTVTHNTESAAGIVKLFRCPAVIVTEQTVVLHQLAKRLELRNAVYDNDIGLFCSGLMPDNNLVIIGSIQALQTPKKPDYEKFDVRASTLDKEFKKLVENDYEKLKSLMSEECILTYRRSIMISTIIKKKNLIDEKDASVDAAMKLQKLTFKINHDGCLDNENNKGFLGEFYDEWVETKSVVGNDYDKLLEKALLMFAPFIKDKLFEIAMKGYATRMEKSEILQRLVGRCELLMIDECDKASSALYKPLFNKWFNGRYAYGFSGTPFDSAKPVEKMVIKERFGTILCEADRKELTEIGAIQPIKYFMIQFGEDNKFDKMAFDIAEKKFMSDNVEFHTKIKSICDSFPNEGTLIIVDTSNIVELGSKLQAFIPGSEFIYGDTSINRRNKIIKAFENREIKVLIGSKIVKRGMDLVGGAENLIVCGGGKLESNFDQIIGRSVRLTKRGWSRVFGFYITCNFYLLQHSRKQLKSILKMNYEAHLIKDGKLYDAKEFVKKRYKFI